MILRMKMTMMKCTKLMTPVLVVHFGSTGMVYIIDTCNVVARHSLQLGNVFTVHFLSLPYPVGVWGMK